MAGQDSLIKPGSKGSRTQTHITNTHNGRVVDIYRTFVSYVVTFCTCSSLVHYHIVVLTTLLLQAEASNGRTSKVKKAVVEEKLEPKNKVNKLNDIAGSQVLIGEIKGPRRKPERT